MYRIFCTTVALFACSAAGASPQFFPGTGVGNALPSGDYIEQVTGAQYEARFKADRFNWDSRLEYDGFPTNSDNTANVTNNIGQLGSRTYAFSLSHSVVDATATWTITDTTSGAVTSLTLETIPGSVANTINIFTNGSRGDTDVSDLAFSGLGASLVDADFPNLDTSPATDTFEQALLFFGNAADLYSADWTLSGNIAFSNFTTNNPNEGNKITVKVQQSELIPAPGAAALLGVAGFVGVRRRR
ncbi:MAG: hypothetical protein AAGH64_06050 [Planctomycetota bacterium]